MSFIAILIATIIPLLVLYLIFTLDLYKTGAFHYIVMCFVWGGIAFGLAAIINQNLIRYGIVDVLALKRFSAPILEEVLKGLMLIFLVRRPHFTYFVDGAIYGFAVGIGFAIFENFQNILAFPDVALNNAVNRVISTNLMHATASGITGIALGFTRFHRSSGRILIFTFGILLAMTIHSGFNNLVTRNLDSLFTVLYAAATGLVGLGVIAAAIKRGLADEKTWIEEKLSKADRITAGEAAVVYRLSDIDNILEPLAMRFGTIKAKQIEKLLINQARLGILLKTLDKLQDKKLIESVKGEIREKQEEMDQARREVGMYIMMYLRGIFPPHDSPLWGRLETLINEHITTQTAQEGAGLWSRLDKATGSPTHSNLD